MYIISLTYLHFIHPIHPIHPRLTPRTRLFIERSNLGSCKLYNPQHPLQVKGYNLALFNSSQSDYLVAPQEFLEDYTKHKKSFKKLKNLESLFFIDVDMSAKEYSKYMMLLQGRINFVNNKTFREHHVVVFVSKLSEARKLKANRQSQCYLFLLFVIIIVVVIVLL